MKIRLQFLLSLLFLVNLVHAQFNWQHTNGPEGAVSGDLSKNDNFVFFSDSYNLYRSTNGDSWERIAPGGIWGIQSLGSKLVGRKYFGAPIYRRKLAFSYDDGENWGYNDLPEGLYYAARSAFCSHGFYLLDGVNNLLYRTQNDGLSWDSIVAPDPLCFRIWAFDDKLYVGSEEKIYRSEDQGSNWTLCSPTAPIVGHLSQLYVSGSTMVLSSSISLWYSNDDGASWVSQPNLTNDIINGIENINGVLYGIGYGRTFIKSPDMGQTWSLIPMGNEIGNLLLEIIGINGKVLLSNDWNGVWRWEEATQQLTQSIIGLNSGSVSSLQVSGKNLIAFDYKKIFRYDILQSNWDLNHSVLPHTFYFHDHVAVNDSGHIFIHGQSNQGKFWVSLDTGRTWIVVPKPPTPFDLAWIGKIWILDNNLFVPSLDGLFRSSNLGQSWMLMPTSGEVLKFNGKYLIIDNKRVWSSDDQGLTWNLTSTIQGKTIYSAFATQDLLFAEMTIDSAQWRRRLYKSPDGINWSYAHDGLPDFRMTGNVDSGEEGQIFEHNGKYFIYHNAEGFFGSKDTCRTWLPLNKMPHHSVAMSDSVFYAGSGHGGGVVSSTAPAIAGNLISGLTYFDDNNNGVKDVAELPYPNVEVNVVSINGYWYNFLMRSDLEGKYKLGVFESPLDTIRPIIYARYIQSINPPYYLVGNGGSDLDFGISFIPNILDLTLLGYYSPRLKTGDNTFVYLRYKNEGTLEQDATIAVKLDPTLIYVSANPAPDAISGDTLKWHISTLGQQEHGTIKIEAHVPINTPLGITLETTGGISSNSADFTPNDNTFVLSGIVYSSFDPNDKHVYPQEGLTAAEISEGKELTYRINFQNTGNYPAERVRITDMLDTALNWSTLRLLAASHEVNSFNVMPGGLLEVVFEGINLPDSTADEVGSHGFVTFAIQRNKAFNPYRSIFNQALIYFDGNEPIFTNEVETKIRQLISGVETPAAADPVGLVIAPNPSTGTFWVYPSAPLTGMGHLSVFNSMGQLMQQMNSVDLSGPVLLQHNNLPNGLYFVRLECRGKTLSGRVVIQNR